MLVSSKQLYTKASLESKGYRVEIRGKTFDVYHNDYHGGMVAIARGIGSLSSLDIVDSIGFARSSRIVPSLPRNPLGR